MSFMTARVEITFDREREALRRIAGWLRRVWRGADPAEPAPRTAAYLTALESVFGEVSPATLGGSQPLVATLVLDASAVLALARGDRRARAFLAHAVASKARMVVPATALLDPNVAIIAEYVADVVAIDARVVRRASRLVTQSRLALPFEAIAVSLAAFAAPAAVLTTNAGAVGALARAADQPELFVFGI